MSVYVFNSKQRNVYLFLRLKWLSFSSTLISIVSFDITIYMRMVTPSIKTAELA